MHIQLQLEKIPKNELHICKGELIPAFINWTADIEIYMCRTCHRGFKVQYGHVKEIVHKHQFKQTGYKDSLNPTEYYYECVCGLKRTVVYRYGFAKIIKGFK